MSYSESAQFSESKTQAPGRERPTSTSAVSNTGNGHGVSFKHVIVTCLLLGTLFLAGDLRGGSGRLRGSDRCGNCSLSTPPNDNTNSGVPSESLLGVVRTLTSEGRVVQPPVKQRVPAIGPATSSLRVTPSYVLLASTSMMPWVGSWFLLGPCIVQVVVELVGGGSVSQVCFYTCPPPH